MDKEARQQRRLFIGTVAALVLISSAAFYLLSHLSEDRSGAFMGTLATLGLAIWIISQVLVSVARVKRPSHQLILMGVSFIQVVPFLYAGVYSAFGFDDICVLGADIPEDVLYFSYVTFTTLGFGDLQPVGFCRALAVTEALLGYILLGLFVAAAVGLAARNKEI